MPKQPDTWTIAKAKAHLSEVIARALADGPQTITLDGRPVANVVAAEEWARRTKRPGNLAEFFAASPLPGANVEIERTRDGPRELTL